MIALARMAALACLCVLGQFVLELICCVGFPVGAAETKSRFAATHSRSQYVHWIELYDANDRRIDPADPQSLPYSPRHTCGRCHDYAAISHGHHFNAMSKRSESDRPGEAWIWTDTRTGTQIPLSYRGWPGTFDPRQLGISEWEFVLQFGRHLPGGGPGESSSSASEQPAVATSTSNSTSTSTSAEHWKQSGSLSIDCMICHSHDRGYSPELRRDQIAKQNFAWAATAALGLATIEGDVASLAEESSDTPGEAAKDLVLPKTNYTPRWNAEKKFFFDIVAQPPANACYFCHSNRVVGEGTPPDWTHDQDVHLRAGMNCSDCHRHGIGHEVVRGFEGEQHSTGEPVTTLSCRGCHLDREGEPGSGGRLGAPLPQHRGLPPLHFGKLSCTACHAGTPPRSEALSIQTSLAHGLGFPSHDDSPTQQPGVVAPVFLMDGGVLYPHRVVWPAYWGILGKDEQIRPLHPESVNESLRRVLRVRRGSTFTEFVTDVKLSSDELTNLLGADRKGVPAAEWTAEEQAKIAEWKLPKANELFLTKLVEALPLLKEAAGAAGGDPVYVVGGKVYRLDAAGKPQSFAHSAAEPYAWKVGHDVRPARWSLGAKGCVDCHVAGAPIFEGQVTAKGPAPDTTPSTAAMYQLAGFDKTKLDIWAQSFQGRATFKYFGFAAMTMVGLILLAYSLVGISGLSGVLAMTSFLKDVGRRAIKTPTTWSWWQRGIYLGLAVSVGILGGTSVFAPLRGDELRGWMLLTHMVGAGVFVFVLPVAAVLWSGANRFDFPDRADFWLSKIMFWLLLASGCGVTLTMLLSMLPLFGTSGLELLLDAHRYLGLLVVVAMVFHLGSMLLQRRR